MGGGGWGSLGAGITNSDSGALPGLPLVLLERGPREGKKPQLRVPKAKGAQGILPTHPLACECPCVSVSVCPYIPRDGFCVSVAVYACVWISMCLRVCEGVRLCMSPCESSVLVILSISVVRFDKIPLSLSPSLSLSLLSTCYSLRKEKKKCLLSVLSIYLLNHSGFSWSLILWVGDTCIPTSTGSVQAGGGR